MTLLRTASRFAPISILLAIGIGCSDGRDPDSLLLLTLDTTRSDYLSCYGGEHVHTPNLDALARNGVLFESTYSPVPLTLPAHASIFTGTDPLTHGIRENGTHALPPDWITLAEVLAQSGYQTAAMVSSFVLAGEFGLEQGFDTYIDQFRDPAGELEGPERNATEVVDLAIEWLRSRERGPFFLWVHFHDPHTPYRPPRPFLDEHSGSPYGAEIAYMDSEIGRLLGEIDRGQRANTHVIAVGDHGEMLGEMGEDTHGIFLDESAVRIPLIWSGPGIRNNVSITSPVRLIDILPTALDFTVRSAPQAIEGTSLRDWLTGESGPAALACHFDSYYPWSHYGWAPIRGLREGRWKYLASAREELYDLEEDPTGRINRIEERPETAARMKKRLVARAQSNLRSPPPVPVTLSEEETAQLRALGYLSPTPISSSRTAPPPSRWRELPDPRERIHVVRLFSRAKESLGRGELDRAESSYREILAIETESARACNGLGVALHQQGRLEEARKALARAIEIDPRYSAAHSNLGALHEDLGDREAAMACYERAIEIDPTEESAVRNLGLAHFELGNPEKALRIFDLQESISPGRTDTLVLKGECLKAMGELEDAVQLYRKILGDAPDHLPASVSLGDCLLALDRTDEALRLFEEMLTLRPDVAYAHYQIGRIFARTDRLQEGLTHLVRATQLNPERATIWAELARAARKAGELDLARMALARLGNLDPRAAEAIRNE